MSVWMALIWPELRVPRFRALGSPGRAAANASSTVAWLSPRALASALASDVVEVPVGVVVGVGVGVGAGVGVAVGVEVGVAVGPAAAAGFGMTSTVPIWMRYGSSPMTSRLAA